MNAAAQTTTTTTDTAKRPAPVDAQGGGRTRQMVGGLDGFAAQEAALMPRESKPKDGKPQESKPPLADRKSVV